jgi:hypothetical protein
MQVDTYETKTDCTRLEVEADPTYPAHLENPPSLDLARFGTTPRCSDQQPLARPS